MNDEKLNIEQTLLQALTQHHHAGQLLLAKESYLSILQIDPNHPVANYNFGVLALQLNQPEASLAYFVAALKADPAHRLYRLGYIDALLQAGKLEMAREMLALARQQALQGEDVDALVVRLEAITQAAEPANAHSQQDPGYQEMNALVALFTEGRYPEAVALAQPLIERYPLHWFSWMGLAMALNQMGQSAEALVFMQKAIELSPNDAEPYSNLGNIFDNLGRLTEAEASYRQALKIKPDYAEAYNNLGNTIRKLGRLGEAETCYRQALKIKPDYAEAYSNLGAVLIAIGQLDEAEINCQLALQLKPDFTEAHNNLGLIFVRLGRLPEAETCYRQVLKYNPFLAETHGHLGIILANQWRLEEAEESYRKSLEINPNVAEMHNNLGNLLHNLGRLNEAIVCYCRALELNPNHFIACINLGMMFNELGRRDEAQVSYRRALEINPHSDIALHNLANLLSGLGDRDDEAIACLERAIELNPGGADAYLSLGNILMRTNQVDKSWTMFRHAQTLRPLDTCLAKKEQADFAVLLLDSPIAGSIPIDYLVGNAPYDKHLYCLIPDAPVDFGMLRTKSNVVINLIADADSGQDILPLALDFVERLGLPTVNHPRLIINTDRETVARHLIGIPLCRIPKTIRLGGHALLEAARSNNLEGFALPLLVRLAGCHGGDDFEKVDNLKAITDFASRQPEANYYLTEYVNYRSTDGFFRKYRLFCINGEILPYHLAIHDEWMVHHFRTDMASQAWMRQEEAAFLKEPDSVFDQLHQSALRAAAAAVGLDFCGIDCALDSNGDIVIFEINATMRVHDEKNEIFAYKNAYIAKIKAAFNLMLNRLAMADAR